MPAWETVDIGKLEAVLAAPQRKHFGHEPHPELADKAAILLYSMVKAHPWANGNKRMGFVATLLFLALNDRWWQTGSEDARIHVTFVAASEARCSTEALAYLSAYFRRRIIPLESLSA
jgi:death on curing protein